MKKKKTGSKKTKAVAVDGRNYELIVVFPLSMNEIEAEKTLADFCRSCDFKISEVDKLGIKTLAYKIKKESKGYYLRFVIKDGDIKKLEKVLSIDDKMLRYLLVRI